jgi:hypothetical protein
MLSFSLLSQIFWSSFSVSSFDEVTSSRFFRFFLSLSLSLWCLFLCSVFSLKKFLWTYIYSVLLCISLCFCFPKKSPWVSLSESQNAAWICSSTRLTWNDHSNGDMALIVIADRSPWTMCTGIYGAWWSAGNKQSSILELFPSYAHTSSILELFPTYAHTSPIFPLQTGAIVKALPTYPTMLINPYSNVKVTVFWIIAPCSLEVYWRFRGAYSLRNQGEPLKHRYTSTKLHCVISDKAVSSSYSPPLKPQISLTWTCLRLVLLLQKRK